jgi:rod shape-determining protein MreD
MKPTGVDFWPALWRRLDKVARHAAPASGLILMMITLSIPGLLPFHGMLRASLVVISVFFWSLYRPACLPAPVLVLIGVLLGLLGGSPLGLWAVLLLLEQGMVLRLRRRLAQRNFFHIWGVFTLLALGLGILQWLARSLLALVLLPAGPVALETGMVVLLYPLVASLLVRAHRGPAAPELA